MSGSNPLLKALIPTNDAIGKAMDIASRQLREGTITKKINSLILTFPKKKLKAKASTPITIVSMKMRRNVDLIRE